MSRRNFWRRCRTDSIRAKTGDHPIAYVPDHERLMECSNEFWKANAFWKRKQGIWVCTQADPIIKWMRGCSPEEAKFELLKRHCHWQWITPATGNLAGELDPVDAVVGRPGSSVQAGQATLITKEHAASASARPVGDVTSLPLN